MKFNTEAEKRCGYFVSANRKALWKVELDMLTMLEKTCEENGINYFLIFGSALGAARHKGFIPWDDDIDIGMLRDDFEKFRRCEKKLFPSYIDIQYGLSDSGVDLLMRIRDSRTTGMICDEVGLKKNKGIFIEIYVYDYVDNNIMQKKQIIMSRIIWCILNMCNKPTDNSIRGILKRIPLKILGAQRLWKIYEENCQKQNNGSKQYVNLIFMPQYAKQSRFMIDKSSVEIVEKVLFEGSLARIPIGNDKYLRQLYGDYMKLPPVEKRGIHHDNIVYYDPNRSYAEYESGDTPQRYFDGEMDLELL